MIQFQNCSPAGSSLAASEDSAGAVKVVDDWNTKSLTFPETQVQLHDSAAVFVAQGLCARKDESNINWVLFDKAKSVFTGSVKCEMGGFQIELAHLDQLKCGDNFVLQVFNDAGQEAKTIVSRKCPPLLAQQSLSNKASEESCYMELDRSPYSLEPVCYQACYIGDKLAFRENVDRTRCGDQVGG